MPILTISSGLESVIQLITVLFIFVFVLGITVFTTRFIGKYQNAHMNSKNIKVIETYRLTNNKYIQIVKTGDKYLAIAVCKDTVSVLTELDEDQITIVEQNELPYEIKFGEILKKVREHTGNDRQEDD